MKNIIIILALALVLTACGGRQKTIEWCQDFGSLYKSGVFSPDQLDEDQMFRCIEAIGYDVTQGESWRAVGHMFYVLEDYEEAELFYNCAKRADRGDFDDFKGQCIDVNICGVPLEDE